MINNNTPIQMVCIFYKLKMLFNNNNNIPINNFTIARQYEYDVKLTCRYLVVNAEIINEHFNDKIVLRLK